MRHTRTLDAVADSATGFPAAAGCAAQHGSVKRYVFCNAHLAPALPRGRHDCRCPCAPQCCGGRLRVHGMLAATSRVGCDPQEWPFYPAAIRSLRHRLDRLPCWSPCCCTCALEWQRRRRRRRNKNVESLVEVLRAWWPFRNEVPPVRRVHLVEDVKTHDDQNERACKASHN